MNTCAIIIWVHDNPITGSVLSLTDVEDPKKNFDEYFVGEKVMARLPRYGLVEGRMGKLGDESQRKDLLVLLRNRAAFSALVKEVCYNSFTQETINEKSGLGTHTEISDDLPSTKRKAGDEETQKCKAAKKKKEDKEKSEDDETQKCKAAKKKKEEKEKSEDDEAKKCKQMAAKQKRDKEVERQRQQQNNICLLVEEEDVPCKTLNPVNPLMQTQVMEAKIESLTTTVSNLSSVVETFLSCKTCLKKAYKAVSGNGVPVSPFRAVPQKVQSMDTSTTSSGAYSCAEQQQKDIAPEQGIPEQAVSPICTRDGGQSETDDEMAYLGDEKNHVTVNKIRLQTVLTTSKSADKLALGLLELVLLKSEVATTTIKGNKQHGKVPMATEKREALRSQVFMKFPCDPSKMEKIWDDLVISLNDKIRNFRKGKYPLSRLSD